MNQELVNRIVNAVLYEGYILYPYRASAKKNRQRFTFGRVYPESYSEWQNGAEPCMMQTECLVKGDSAALTINVRFLHPMSREVGYLSSPTVENSFRSVPELRIDDKIYQTWLEAVERDVRAGSFPIRALVHESRSVKFQFPETRSLEQIQKSADGGAAILRQQALADGCVELGATAIDAGVFKVTARIFNRSPIPSSCLDEENAVLMRTFASTHTILQVEDGEFLSLIDPPPDYREAAAACHNIGTWPVLVGDEHKHEQDAMLSSPIILYDYPTIAPESPGDLFDAAEIDEILSLRILAMTDDEKREMRQVDEHARRILERTESLPVDQFLNMHGALRNASHATEDFFNPAAPIQSVRVGAVDLRVGSRVRIHPKGRADVMDIALAGKTAVIEAVECDAEDRIQLALVLEDDPGKDLGMMRQPGHRFFYGIDEVEPLEKQ